MQSTEIQTINKYKTNQTKSVHCSQIWNLENQYTENRLKFRNRQCTDYARTLKILIKCKLIKSNLFRIKIRLNLVPENRLRIHQLHKNSFSGKLTDEQWIQ